MFLIQTIIHKIEVGGGGRYVKFALLPFALLALFVCYDFRGAKNLTSPEAMDAAQLGRKAQRAVYAGGDACGKDPCSVYDHPLVDGDRAEERQQMKRRPVRRRPASLEHSSRADE